MFTLFCIMCFLHVFCGVCLPLVFLCDMSWGYCVSSFDCVYLVLYCVFLACILWCVPASCVLEWYVGHSGQIGNAPNLAGKKSKSMLQMFSMHIWYSFEFLTMKKAKGKLKMDYGMLSSPYFVTPVSRNDEGFLEIIPSSRLWFQVSWHYLKS